MSLAASKRICNYSLLLWLLHAWTATHSACCKASLVRDVRVHVYQPHRNSEFVSALIVWDALALNGSQADYAVNLYFDDYLVTSELLFDPNVFLQLWEGPPFPVPSNNTHFSLTLRVPSLNYPSYPVFSGYVYSVTVSYTTDSGKKGESDPVHFNTSVLSPPPEVLATRLDQCFLVGENHTVAMEHVGHPVTVNAVDRELFHYQLDTHAIYQSTLDSNISEVVVILPSDLIPVALSYDWLGETIYLAGTNSTDGSFGIWKIVVMMKSLHHLFEKTLDEEVQVTMVMNPFTGHLYWTEHVAISDIVTLCQLNLRNSVMTTLASSSSNLQLSSALALDSITDKLWVSDQSNGDILSCDVSTGAFNCQVEVNTSLLLSSISRIESISVDELQVYWTSQEGLSVYHVLREDPSSSLMTFSLPTHHGYRLIGLSPGQQPWSAADPWQGYLPAVDPIDACLTPDYGENTNDPMRPVAQLVAKTNSSLVVNWTMPQLTPSCQGAVFSYPTLHYNLYVTHEMDPLKGFPLTLLDNQYTLTDLSPYTDYEFEVEGRNGFTPTDTSTKYGTESILTTAEGVPEGVVENIMSFPYGPRNMFITWDRFSGSRLKGDESSQFFFAELETIMSHQTSKPHLDVIQGLEPSTNYTFHVVVNNGVFNSSIASIQTNSTWPRPPPPQTTEPAVSVTTESLTAVVDLSQSHQDISQLHLELYPENSPNLTATSATANLDILPNASNPVLFELNLTNISSLGSFDLRAIAMYRSVHIPHLDLELGPTMETSDAVRITIADVPDAPRLNLSNGSTLIWTVPYDNGSPVNRFFLLARNATGLVTSIEKELSESASQTADPLQDFSLQPEEEYTISVVASNVIGNSSESNSVSFTAPAVSFPTATSNTTITSTTVSFPTATANTTNTSTTVMATSTDQQLELLLYIPIATCGGLVITVVILVVAIFITAYQVKRYRTFKVSKIQLEMCKHSTINEKAQFEKVSIDCEVQDSPSVAMPALTMRIDLENGLSSPQTPSVTSPSELLLPPKVEPVIEYSASVFTNLSTCEPTGTHSFHNGNSTHKLDLQEACNDPNVSASDSPPNGISPRGE